MTKLLLVLMLVAVGCGDAGEPATRVDATGGAGGEAAASGGAPGTGGAAGAAAGGQSGIAGAPAATGGSPGTGGMMGTGGSGTGGKVSPSCLIPLSQISGPVNSSLGLGYIVGGGTSTEQSDCTQQAAIDAAKITQVIDGVPTGPTGWTESSYMIALSGTYDCQATISYTKTGSGVRPCNELVTVKVVVTP